MNYFGDGSVEFSFVVDFGCFECVSRIVFFVNKKFVDFFSFLEFGLDEENIGDG